MAHQAKESLRHWWIDGNLEDHVTVKVGMLAANCVFSPTRTKALRFPRSPKIALSQTILNFFSRYYHYPSAFVFVPTCLYWCANYIYIIYTCIQGGSQQATPFFSLTELKDGLYSIEFNSSISLLQSFFICVAVLSCKRPFNLLDMSEAKVFKEPILNENDGSQRRASAKYAPNPSSSPVGRV